MAAASCVAAAQAGVDVIDASISSLSSGTGQPPIETFVGIFEGTDRDTGLDLDALIEIADFYKDARAKYAQFERGSHGVEVSVLRYQIPGGMLSNLVNQLREQNALDRYREVTDEIQRVRADLGYPPLVTPSSQIVGTQATFNVLTGQRYSVIIDEVKNYLRNMYGQPPGEVNEELRKQAIGDEEPITCRPGRPARAGNGPGPTRDWRPGRERRGRALVRHLWPRGARFPGAPSRRRHVGDGSNRCCHRRAGSKQGRAARINSQRQWPEPAPGTDGNDTLCVARWRPAPHSTTRRSTQMVTERNPMRGASTTRPLSSDRRQKSTRSRSSVLA